MPEWLRDLLGLAVVPLIVVWVLWVPARCNQILDDWATENRITILCRDYRVSRKALYIRESGFQIACYITIIDAAGKQKTGTACIGGALRSVFISRVFVEWDESSSAKA